MKRFFLALAVFTAIALPAAAQTRVPCSSDTVTNCYTPTVHPDVAVTSGPATIADGADVAEGATTDAAPAAGAAGSVSAKLRLMTTQLNSVSTAVAALQAGLPYFQTTQPVSNAALTSIDTKIPAAPATAGNQSTANASLASIDTKTLTLVADPCQANAKLSVPISQAASAKLFSQVSAKKNYICSIMVVGSDAENISLVEGTGSTCGTSTAAIIGGTTAANGPNLAANGGFSMGSGVASVASGTNANFDVCLFQSGSGRVAGVLTYVQQ